MDTTYLLTNLSRTVNATEEASEITSHGIEFYPRNEGERASYLFTFIPTNSIEDTMILMIQFPLAYDSLLGYDIKCEATEGLQGQPFCYVDDHRVFMKGFQTYTPQKDNLITLAIYGVVNPNSDIDIGSFTVATFYENTETFVDFNNDFGDIDIEDAPAWAYLYDAFPNFYYSRLKTHYTFNVTLNLLEDISA